MWRFLSFLNPNVPAGDWVVMGDVERRQCHEIVTALHAIDTIEVQQDLPADRPLVLSFVAN